MKATLIITNIYKLYTCDRDHRVLSDAFIALYHDKIIDVACGDYSKWLDQDLTRIIDATNRIVLPAFIEPCFSAALPKSAFEKLETESRMHLMSMQGILNMVSPLPELARKSLYYDCFYREKADREKLFSLPDSPFSYSDELISCSSGQIEVPIYSLQPALYSLWKFGNVSANELLEQCTSKAAERLYLFGRGRIEPGYFGDLLVLNARSFEEYLETFGQNLFQNMIKDGIMVWPYILRC